MLSILSRQFLSFDKELTLYRPIPTFNDPKEESFGKHVFYSIKVNRGRRLLPDNQSKREIIILAMFILSSANAFNLVTSKICLFDKELINAVG